MKQSEHDLNVERARMDALLAKCAEEPIHIPGAIQPHGALLVFDRDRGLVAWSANAGEWAAGEPAEGLGAVALLGEATTASLDEMGWSDNGGIGGWLRTELNGLPRTVTAHANDAGLRLVEIEAAVDGGGVETVRGLDRVLSSMHVARSADGVLERAVEAVHQLTGYDRVMGYRFDAEYNGTVIAEHRREDLDSFLGQRFPASDIPSQARALYLRKRLRVISDVGYAPVPLRVAPTFAPIDLSQADLRSVSPVHVVYLQNMGVAATMVISLVYEGRLLGLIACHHYSASKLVSPAVRDAAVLIGNQAAVAIGTRDEVSAVRRALSKNRAHGLLLDALSREPDFGDGLGSHMPELMRLTDAEGAAVLVGERLWSGGRTPPDALVREIASFMRERRSTAVFATDCLREHLASAAAHTECAAGLLAVSLRPGTEDCVLWFRPETVQTIDWAGNPYSKVEMTDGDGGGARLVPRESFRAWIERVADRSLPWDGADLDIAEMFRGSMVNVVVQLDDLSRQIAERSRAERQAREFAEGLRTANEALDEARRRAEAANDAKSQFIANLSHELRTPLNSILGFTELVASEPMPEAERAAALATVRRNGEHLLALISDLLDTAALESGSLNASVRAESIDEVVRLAVESLRGQAEAKGLSLEVSLPSPGTGLVLTDARRLTQIVMNLLSNAVRHTDRGGVRVVCERREGVSLPMYAIRVIDDGCGIGASVQARLFRPFSQGDESFARSYGGSGLGLFISKRLAELLGGDLRLVRSGVDEGSEFEVVVSAPPVGAGEARGVSAAAGSAGVGVEPAAGEDGQRATRVLVVEDSVDNQRLIGLLLRNAGYEVQIESSGEDGVRAALESAAGGRAFDVVFMDVQMPGMDGLEATRYLRERGYGLPIVALTAHAHESDRQRSLQAGCDDHLTKPISKQSLIAAVDRVLPAA